MKTRAKDYICIALDGSPQEALELIEDIGDRVAYYKVGIVQFYTKEGFKLIDAIKGNGSNVFLDLKIHDIPNTAGLAAANLAMLLDEKDIINVHAQGGYKMMRAVKDRMRDISYAPPRIIAVTLLTSFDKQSASIDLRSHDDPDILVTHYACQAYRAGCDGIVCSAKDIPMIKSYMDMDTDFLYVTPGIRLTGDDSHDQKRIMTPDKAIKNGSKLLVIGRSITKAKDPGLALAEVEAQIAKGLEE